ncbi:gamma-interferon-inducible lysosomal thiol reductase-like [Ostrinia nubilalis]|uniref:gamma-interferon-inducible lysosomal thiol reductase-like n=1 Tax=Ostrinia nubilalis TaxID=29057 RepID=UPI003082601B
MKGLTVNIIVVLCSAASERTLAMNINSQSIRNQEIVELVLLPEYDKVQVVLLYETLCPACRQFDTSDFKLLIQELDLYVDIHTYPYGNAHEKVINNETVTVCQHGPTECYGNMLHGCALNLLSNTTKAQLFNSCTMESQYADASFDDAAYQCGSKMYIAADKIMECAKSDQAKLILSAYGKKSRKYTYDYVPFVVINGKEWTNHDQDLIKVVCAEFKNPPPICQQYL